MFNSQNSDFSKVLTHMENLKREFEYMQLEMLDLKRLAEREQDPLVRIEARKQLTEHAEFLASAEQMWLKLEKALKENGISTDLSEDQ